MLRSVEELLGGVFSYRAGPTPRRALTETFVDNRNRSGQSLCEELPDSGGGADGDDAAIGRGIRHTARGTGASVEPRAIVGTAAPLILTTSPVFRNPESRSFRNVRARERRDVRSECRETDVREHTTSRGMVPPSPSSPRAGSR